MRLLAPLAAALLLLADCKTVQSVVEPLACGTARLSALQSEFDALVTPQGADAAERSDGYDKLARQANDCAERTSGETRVALRRLAALSAWQSDASGSDGLAEASAADGRKQCESLRAAGKIAPARDCAIVAAVPMLIEGDRLLAMIAKVVPAKPFTGETPVAPEQAKGALALYPMVRNGFLSKLAGWDADLARGAPLPEGFDSWFRAAKNAYGCRFGQLLVPAGNWVLATPDPALTQQLATAGQALETDIRNAYGISASPSLCGPPAGLPPGSMA